MDLDSVQKKTVSTVSRKLYLFYLSSVPDFQDWRMTSVIFGEIPFSLYFFLTHDKLLIKNWECLVDFWACMENTIQYKIWVATMGHL